MESVTTRVTESSLLLWALLLTTAWTVGESGKEVSDVVAEVAGSAITQMDLQQAAAKDLEQLEMQSIQFKAKQERKRHQILEARLKRIVGEKLVGLEATDRSVSIQELLDSEVYSQIGQPTEEEIDSFYKSNEKRLKGTKEKLVPLIRQHLTSQKRQQGYQRYVDQLKQKFSVAYHLQPFRVNVTTAGHPEVGPANAPVTIVEFSDFECPYCSRFLTTLKSVTEKYRDQVRLVFRQFPLNSIHSSAQKAAEASLCASDQGKFWEMHDLMFADQKNLQIKDLQSKAESAGLDLDIFESCLSSDKYQQRVLQDVAEGSVAGVTGTPSLFINGRPLSGNVPFQNVIQIIEDELKQTKTSPTRD